MPVSREDPAHFTKEKLRDQLIAHHVPLPEGVQKKDVYLQMYMKYVPLEQRATDFSSDEDEDGISDTTGRKNETITRKMDVQNLTDAELKEQLIKHGTLPGPILPTTRSVYEKKLKQLLDQSPPVPQTRQNGNGDMEQYSDSEEEDPRERRAQHGRDASIADISNSSIFNHSKKRPMLTVVVPVPRRSSLTPISKLSDCTTPARTAHHDTQFTTPSEASKSNTAFESSFSVSRMVEQMDQRPSMCHVGGHQKTTGSGIRSSYSAKDALMVDKNTMTYRTPTNTPKACVYARQNRFQAICSYFSFPWPWIARPAAHGGGCAGDGVSDFPEADDLLQKDEQADRYVPSTAHPLGLSATRRKPIKGAAGRPIQFKYDDLLTKAKLVEQTKAQPEKVPPRKGVPLYVHVALFVIVAFLAVVFLTMEHNPENPFHAHVEKVDVHQPQ
ncbi:LEM domain-containing protein 1 isoform X2 [Lissotriton helveticus]